MQFANICFKCSVQVDKIFNCVVLLINIDSLDFLRPKNILLTWNTRQPVSSSTTLLCAQRDRDHDPRSLIVSCNQIHKPTHTNTHKHPHIPYVFLKLHMIPRSVWRQSRPYERMRKLYQNHVIWCAKIGECPHQNGRKFWLWFLGRLWNKLKIIIAN